MTATVGQLVFAAVGPRHVCLCRHAAFEHYGLWRDCETEGCGCVRYKDAR